MAIPMAVISALYLIWAKAIIKEVSIPTRIANRIARIQLPVIKLTSTAANADVSIIPSVPMFVMFPCSVIVAASAANRIGVEARIVA